MKTTIVTGGAAGIGKETATLFAGRGHRVIIADIDENTADATAAEIKATGGTAVPYPLDVRSEDEWGHFAEWVKTQFGPADILVNNAGVMDLGGFVDTKPAAWQRMVDIDLMSAIYGSKAFGQQMIDAGVHGHIVNVASAAAFLPSELDTAYGVAKAAVLMATQSLRVEMAPHGIGVTAICPGAVRTNLLQHGQRNGIDTDQIADWSETVGAAQASLAPNSPQKVARRIVRAVDKNWAVLPVGPEAWFIYGAFRASPALVRASTSIMRFERLEGLESRFRPLMNRLAQRRENKR